MKKYIKRPIPVHAFKWSGNPDDINFNVPDKDIPKYFDFMIIDESHAQLRIKSLEGYEYCPVGDYIIRGIHGEYYPCDPKIFKESYKEVK